LNRVRSMNPKNPMTFLSLGCMKYTSQGRELTIES
jgi:hypothetical protein